MGYAANAAQEEAIKTINGHVLVISCPGSGKTTTLLRRIQRMTEEGVSPSQILMVTFSTASAADMKARYGSMEGTKSGVTFSTLHALCFRILLERKICSPEDLLTEEEKRDFFFENARRYRNMAGDYGQFVQAVITDISVMRSNYIPVDAFDPKACGKEDFLNLLRMYEDYKSLNGKIDFDDMLFKCLAFLEDYRAALDEYQNRWKYIQVDEYQDINNVQRDIIYLLSQKSGNLCVVGDDDQSIYAFRGARPEIMLGFSKDFPDAKVINMSTNYRSSEAVVNAAGSLIVKNTGRFKKDFLSYRGNEGVKGHAFYYSRPSQAEEMEALAAHVKVEHEKGIPYSDMAILFRTNQQSMAPASALKNAGIPFYVTEPIKSVFSGWMYRTIRDYALLAMGEGGPKQINAVLNKPQRFLPENVFSKVAFDRKAMLSAAGSLSRDAYWKYEAAIDSINAWFDTLGPGSFSRDSAPADFFEALTVKNGIRFDKFLKNYTKFRKLNESEVNEEFETIKSTALLCKTIRQFMDHAERCVRFAEEQSRNKDRDGVAVLTMHASKGLEWKSVFVIDCNDKIVPHKNSVDEPGGMEEERRLLYVAMTRAEDDLYLYSYGKMASPFITQIKSLLEIEGRKMVNKCLPGTKVSHIKYGDGVVLGFRANAIRVRFGLVERLFAFPQTFDEGKLKYC